MDSQHRPEGVQESSTQPPTHNDGNSGTVQSGRGDSLMMLDPLRKRLDELSNSFNISKSVIDNDFKVLKAQTDEIHRIVKDMEVSVSLLKERDKGFDNSISAFRQATESYSSSAQIIQRHVMTLATDDSVKSLIVAQ